MDFNIPFMDLDIQNYFKQYKKFRGASFENMIWGNPKISKIEKRKLKKAWESWAPTNPADPFNKILKILDMGPMAS